MDRQVDVDGGDERTDAAAVRATRRRGGAAGRIAYVIVVFLDRNKFRPQVFHHCLPKAAFFFVAPSPSSRRIIVAAAGISSSRSFVHLLVDKWTRESAERAAPRKAKRNGFLLPRPLPPLPPRRERERREVIYQSVASRMTSALSRASELTIHPSIRTMMTTAATNPSSLSVRLRRVARSQSFSQSVVGFMRPSRCANVGRRASGRLRSNNAIRKAMDGRVKGRGRRHGGRRRDGHNSTAALSFCVASSLLSLARPPAKGISVAHLPRPLYDPDPGWQSRERINTSRR